MLDAFEQDLGVRLPTSFRDALLSTDPPVAGEFALGAERRAVTKYYGVRAPDPLDDLVVRRLALHGIVPDDLLAFGADDHGELVCIGIAGRRRGAVYLVRIPGDRHTPIPPRLLAPTYADFIDLADPVAQAQGPLLVALIESDDRLRADLATGLRARGFEVIEARHGVDALDVVHRGRVRPSLVVLDLDLPVMDGAAVLHMQPSEPLLDGVPVVVIAAHDVAGLLPSTVRALIRKPVVARALLETVERLSPDLELPRRMARGSDGLYPLKRRD